jgi:hypothetical protein
MQVLKALNKSSAADQAKHLRQAAGHLHADQGASRWLASGLVPQVLAILHSLPSGRPPKDAIEVCTAATAVLTNLLMGLEAPEHLTQFHALLAADQAACAALVHWGMAPPEASRQLPPARRPKLLANVMVPETAAADAGHPFWTPFTTCCSFLVVVDVSVATVKKPTQPDKSWISNFGMQGAVTPGVIAQALRVAVQHPCSTFPAVVFTIGVPDVACSWSHRWLVVYVHAGSGEGGRKPVSRASSWLCSSLSGTSWEASLSTCPPACLCVCRSGCV